MVEPVGTETLEAQDTSVAVNETLMDKIKHASHVCKTKTEEFIHKATGFFKKTSATLEDKAAEARVTVTGLKDQVADIRDQATQMFGEDTVKDFTTQLTKQAQTRATEVDGKLDEKGVGGGIATTLLNSLLKPTVGEDGQTLSTGESVKKSALNWGMNIAKRRAGSLLGGAQPQTGRSQA